MNALLLNMLPFDPCPKTMCRQITNIQHLRGGRIPDFETKRTRLLCKNFIHFEQFSILLQCEAFPHLTLFVCSTFGPPLPHSGFQMAKNPPNISLKKILNLADHTCAYNDLTNFEYDAPQ